MLEIPIHKSTLHRCRTCARVASAAACLAGVRHRAHLRRSPRNGGSLGGQGAQRSEGEATAKALGSGCWESMTAQGGRPHTHAHRCCGKLGS
ncbi:hypothetical protein U9M48_029981 [Paspalum notatum var. saurae]|uniref:Uncharacterized protein n=1 Tax=Paspalum notatum var. saurae TaxID=547442 RepID=A0AAQ3X3A2_PASNO